MGEDADDMLANNGTFIGLVIRSTSKNKYGFFDDQARVQQLLRLTKSLSLLYNVVTTVPEQA